MKKFLSIILLLLIFSSIYYSSTGFNSFKTYAIIVDNTDAPYTNGGLIKAVNVNTLEEYIFIIESSTTTFNLPGGKYNFFGCIYPETGELYEIEVAGDMAIKLEYRSGNCPF
jgi:hypothetical protein